MADFIEYRGIPVCLQDGFCDLKKGDRFLTHLAKSLSNMTGDEWRWVNVPHESYNPFGETGVLLRKVSKK